MSDIHVLAIRFADLWAVDPHQMVREIYAPDIQMESMARLARDPIEGSEQLHALETGFLEMIPDHRHELVRVTAHEDVACLETTIVAPRTNEYAPACVWWWMGERSQVAAEVGWFDWEARSPDAARAHGLVPPMDRRPRGDHEWYQAFVASLAEGWTHDPFAVLDRSFSPDCVFEHVGVSRCEGLEAARRAEEELGRTLPIAERWIDVHEMVADGAVIAVLFTCGTTELVSRGTAVLSLGDDDRIVSARLYWDWSTAVRFDEVHVRGAKRTPIGRMSSTASD